MNSARFRWSKLVVAVTLAVLSLSAAEAEICTSDSVAPECLIERSQAGLEQADGELNRTYPKGPEGHVPAT